MYCCDIVLPILSVCLSVQCVEMNEHIVTHFSHYGTGIILVFPALPPLHSSKGNPLSWVKYKGWEFFVCKYRHLSRKRYEIDPQLLWNSNSKS